MATRWPEVRLAAIAEVSSAKVDPSLYPVQAFQLFSLPSFDEGQIPSIELGSEIRSQKTVVPPTAVLVSKLNPHIPRVWEPSAFIGLPAVASTEFLVLTPRQGCDRRYLKYVCMSPKVRIQMESLVTGTSGSHQRVRPEDFLNIKVDSPPTIAQQRAIAHVLGTLDDKIELNRQMNETLEAMARALFKSWFIDFDPVHAKAEGRDTGLPPDVAALFPDSFEDSELGELPVGWRIGTLGDFAELNPESWSAATIPNEVDYVDLANTKWGRIESTQRLPRKEAPSRARRVLRPGDTIVGTVRPGNGSYSFIAEDGLTGSTGFAVLRPRATAYTALIYLAATEHDNIVRLAHLADGAAYPAVRPEVVLETRVVQPDRPIVEFFARCTRHIMGGQATNDAETRTLASLRDSLLPRLLSGELEPSSPADLIEESGRRVRHAM